MRLHSRFLAGLACLSSLVSSCSSPTESKLPHLRVEMRTTDDERDPTTGENPNGQLRGAYWIRFSADGLTPLTFDAGDDPGEDLLPIVGRVQSISDERAIVSGFVGFGGGVSSTFAYLVGARAGRLVLLDTITSMGSSFDLPWQVRIEVGAEGLELTPCSGSECGHHMSSQPTDVSTSRWSLSPEQYLARHVGGAEQRKIVLRADRFELASGD